MFKWYKSTAFSFNIALFDNNEVVCVFKFPTRIEADRFIARNSIRV